MKQAIKKVALATACAGGMFATLQAEAANWLMLQGTEPDAAVGRAKVWGFMQAQYQKDYSDGTGAGDVLMPAKVIGPNLDNQEQFTVNRAAIAMRGTGMPLDPKVNYFVMGQFGHNGVTYGNKGATLTDASITLNHFKAARIRAGLFKTPGMEEILQGIVSLEYINFTETANQLVVERFPTAADANQGSTAEPNAGLNQYSQPVSAGRDTGVQVFGSFMSGKWDTSYAIMTGNGYGLNMGDNDGNRDTYLYLSTEYVYGGKGPRREGVKMFVWKQSGKRTDAYDVTQEEDRIRSGVGIKYYKKPFRIKAEYVKGEGMIFQGQHRPGHVFNDFEAHGYYVDLGFYVPKSNWEIDARYDYFVRDENHPTSVDGDESTSKTTTLGAQYHFNLKTRFTLNVINRDWESDTAAIHANVENVGRRVAMQLTHIF